MISQSRQSSLFLSLNKLIYIPALFSFFLITLLSGCDNKVPTTLGFVGPTSGRNSDLGIDGRNGFLLAIEQKNKAGGINGLDVKYQLHDDRHIAETGVKIFESLSKDDNVTAIVGPMTSYIGTSVIDIIRDSNKVTISPTVTTPELSNVDDPFFRVLSTTDINAINSAKFLAEDKDIKSASIIYDIGNAAYSESWKDAFSESFYSTGGKIINTVSYTSNAALVVDEFIDELMTPSAGAVIIIANSMDASLFIQQIKSRKNNSLTILTAEWAGTERLLELSGKKVEGVYIPQYIDRDSQDPEYLAFKERYQDRFNRAPGFASITSYNATSVILTAIESQGSNELLKDTLLRIKDFGGIQTPVKFNDFGENPGSTYMVRVENGKFIVQ